MNKFILALFLASVVNSLCNHQSCMLCGNGDSCLICNAELNYATDNGGKCNIVFIDFCDLKDEYGVCYRCRAGWLPVLGSCKKDTSLIADRCLRYGCDLSCVVCGPNRYPDADGICQPLTGDETVQNCLVYDRPNYCRECVQGYFAFNGVCIEMPADCIAPSPTSCLVCPRNSFVVATSIPNVANDFWRKWVRYILYGIFDISGAICQKNEDPNCLLASSPTTCVRCRDRFFVDADGFCRLVNPIIPYCRVYLTDTICLRCDDGFYLLNEACVPFPRLTDNCLYYASPTLCIRCVAPYYIADITTTDPNDPNFPYANNENYKQCVLSVEIVDNCDWYVGEKLCRYCTSAYYLVGDVCTLIQFNVDNCAVYDANGCLFCVTNYYLVDPRTCSPVTPPLDGCYRNDTNDTCLECLPGYQLDQSNLCVLFLVDNCRIYNFNAVCLYCKLPYYFDGNFCVEVNQPADPLCDIFSDANNCFRCIDNFDLVNGICQKVIPPNCEVASAINQCAFCMPPFYYDDQTNQCIEVNREVCDCERYGADENCILCGNRKYLNGNNECVNPAEHIDHCYSYSSPNTCQRCLTGFYVSANGDECVVIPNQVQGVDTDVCGCTYFTGVGQCEECEAGKYLEGGRCVNIPDYVANCFSYVNGVCVHCDGDRYLINELQCAPVPTPIDFCYFYENGTGICQYCDEGYIINANNECQPIDGLVLNCRSYSARGICEICEDLFYLDGNVCNSTDAVLNCARYANATTCSQCLPLFYLFNNRCFAIGGIENCKYAGGPNQCDICLPDYYAEGGVCISSAVFNLCAEYAGNNICNVCQSNYYLDLIQIGNPAVTYGQCRSIFTPITGCAIYNDLFNCKSCDTNHYLNLPDLDPPCLPISRLIPNCKVYLNADTCEFCENYDPSEFELYGESYISYALGPDGKSCVENCEIANATGCERCSPGFYPLGNGCTPVINNVDFCLFYIGDNQCLICENGYEITQNGVRCIPSGNPCNGNINGPVTCGICRTGYVADRTGVCQELPNPLPGCLLHTLPDNVVDIANAVCSVCDPRHYHTAIDGTCSPISPLVYPPSGPSIFEELICAWRYQR